MPSEPVDFTILVPTRNRADTLAYCLKSLAAQNYARLSVIVSDNHSKDHTRDVVESIGDARITCVSPPRSLSMRDNWEYALSQVPGGWASVVGDDDGLAPGALERVAQVIEDHKVEAVTSSWCRYTWPGDGLNHANKLILPYNSGVEIRDAKLWRRRVLSGAWRYIELPYLYTGGFVHMDAVDRARGSGNRFFNAINPDIYSGFAISGVVEKYAFIHDPIAVRGTSSHSTGASSLQGSANQQPKTDFLKDNLAFIHPLLRNDNLPMSTHLFVYEAYLQASSVAGTEAESMALADVRRQMAIVSALASKKERAAIHSYQTSVLRRSAAPGNLTFMERIWASYLVRWVYYIVEFNRVIHSGLIDMSRLGIRDVFTAGIAAKASASYCRSPPERT